MHNAGVAGCSPPHCIDLVHALLCMIQLKELLESKFKSLDDFKAAKEVGMVHGFCTYMLILGSSCKHSDLDSAQVGSDYLA